MFSTWVKKTTVIIIILILFSLSFSKYGQSIPLNTLNCLQQEAYKAANNLMYASVPGKVTITDNPTLGYLTIHVTPGYNYAPNPLGNYQFIPVAECMSIVAPSLMVACNQTGILKPAEYVSGLPSYSYAANTSSYCEMKIPYSAASLNCPAGQSLLNGQCQPCGSNQYAQNNACISCPQGSYSNSGSTSCSSCPAGTRWIKLGDPAAYPCSTCSAGTYSAAGATNCTNCPAGQTSSSGATACTNCPAGQISVSGGVCTNCPGGMKSTDGKTCPAVCTNGQVPAANRQSCVDCPGGMKSTDGKTCPAVCTNGQVPAANGQSCVDCPGGMKSADSKTCPAVCTPGKITSANGIDCEDCPAGTSSPSASNTCTPCAAGQFSAKGGLCTPCPTGQTSQAGASSCEISCGNGRVDNSEQCDLGANNGKNNGCTNTCTIQNLNWTCTTTEAEFDALISSSDPDSLKSLYIQLNANATSNSTAPANNRISSADFIAQCLSTPAVWPNACNQYLKDIKRFKQLNKTISIATAFDGAPVTPACKDNNSVVLQETNNTTIKVNCVPVSGSVE